jgi:hypothetical protein
MFRASTVVVNPRGVLVWLSFFHVYFTFISPYEKLPCLFEGKYNLSLNPGGQTMPSRSGRTSSAAPPHGFYYARIAAILLANAIVWVAASGNAAGDPAERRPMRAPQTVMVKPQAPASHCTIQDDNSGKALPDSAHGDPLFQIVTSEANCSQNALEFRKRLLALGYILKPAMVGNRGFNNPLPAGSFSFFESVSSPTGSRAKITLNDGDWFFGHFQVANNNNSASASELVEQQQGTQDNLLLESIAWDPTVGYFRFYEIRGTGQGGQWFYRGSSIDIQNDITNLWRDTNPGQPIFGKAPASNPGRFGGQNTAFKLRCSGCHMDGGPIMKELAGPHDSWWRTVQPLPLGSLVVQQELQPILSNVIDADTFAKFVQIGVDKLLSSKPYLTERSKRSLQEQLRPLFCEQEVNLESDQQPFTSFATTIAVPASFFIDPRLLPKDQQPITIDKAAYTNALTTFQSSFFDYQSSASAGIDADHAFETPVKGWGDIAVIAALTGDQPGSDGKLVTPDFVTAVLAVDMTRPMFSARRCGLLTLLPEKADNGWLQTFEQILQNNPSASAPELYRNLTDPAHNADAQRRAAEALMDRIRQNLTGADKDAAVTAAVRLLTQRRLEVFQAQISQHPQGEIFEPSFRLIFPTMQLFGPDQQQLAYGGVSGQFWVDPADGRVKLVAP